MTPLVRLGAAVAATIIVALAGIDLLRAFKYPPNWLAEVRSIRPVVTTDTPVYTDTLTLRALNFLSGYPNKTEWIDFNAVGSPEQIRPGSLVIVNRPAIKWLDDHGGIWEDRISGYRRHAFYESRPASWTPVRQTATFSAYRTDVTVTKRR
jgi:hypothetical protein